MAQKPGSVRIRNTAIWLALASAVIYVVGLTVWFYASRSAAFRWQMPEREGRARVLHVAAIADNEPYSFFNEAGEPCGFDVELISRIGEKLNADIDLTMGNWNELRTSTEQGKYDLLMGVTTSDLRRKLFSLSAVTYYDTFAIYGRQNEPPFTTDVADIAVMRGAYEGNYDIISNFLIGIKREQIHYYPTYMDCLRALEKGERSHALLPSRTANLLIKGSGFNDIESKRDSVYVSFFAIGSSLGKSALIEEVNTVLASFQNDGTIDEIRSHWFVSGKVATFSEFFAERVNEALLFLTLILLAAALLFSLFVHNIHQAEKEEMYRILQLQDELRQALKDANAANQAKTNFLSSMSHDIRTPMNAIMGIVDIALTSLADPGKVRDCLNTIRTSGNQLVSLVNDILDISAIESGRITVKAEPHNISESFSQYSEIFEPLMKERSQSGIFNIHDITVPWVKADGVRVKQIFNNLLSNAVKYTQNGGHIEFEAYQTRDAQGKLLTVGVVSDNGAGMDKEYMQHMWESFSRGMDTRINKVQGFGLGLTIVRDLVELMHGDIKCQSEPGKGTTFTVTLPLEAGEKEKAELEERIDYSVLENLSILMAEDNNLNWEIAHELLSMSGIKSERACDGKECLEKFSASADKTYDIILMDMQMPVMNGIEATKAIRICAHPQAKTIPIIALTANAFADDIENCREAGMNDHLSKPMEMQKVLRTLQKYAHARNAAGAQQAL